MKPEIVIGDIAALPFHAGAIVNAANEELVHGGGVCGAIFAAAGARDLARVCAAVAPCPTGEARITPGFALNADWIVHAVGPDLRSSQKGAAQLLAAAYTSALRLADDAGAQSIALPAISTGIYGFPPIDAAPIAHAAITAFTPTHLQRCLVVFRSEESAAPMRAVAG